MNVRDSNLRPAATLLGQMFFYKGTLLNIGTPNANLHNVRGNIFKDKTCTIFCDFISLLFPHQK
jgi:hypothetical protein